MIFSVCLMTANAVVVHNNIRGIGPVRCECNCPNGNFLASCSGQENKGEGPCTDGPCQCALYSSPRFFEPIRETIVESCMVYDNESLSDLERVR